MKPSLAPAGRLRRLNLWLQAFQLSLPDHGLHWPMDGAQVSNRQMVRVDQANCRPVWIQSLLKNVVRSRLTAAHQFFSSRSEFGFELRQYLEQVTHQAEIRHFENGGIGICIDGDNRACILDAGQVLDGA